MDISKTTLRSIFDYLIPLVTTVFPGIFVLEVAFARGFFSNPPTTIYEFLLFLIWTIAAGIPFSILVGISLLPLHSQVAKHGIVIPQTEDYEESVLEAPLLLILLLAYYILTKAVSTPTDLVLALVPAVSRSLIHATLSFIYVIPIGLLLGIPYRWAMVALAKSNRKPEA